jgi:hypothetical protein
MLAETPLAAPQTLHHGGTFKTFVQVQTCTTNLGLSQAPAGPKFHSSCPDRKETSRRVKQDLARRFGAKFES